MADRLLLFGGTFDPIHHGHLIAATTAAEWMGAARIVLIPSGRPPHKPATGITPGAHRLAMCRAAVQGDPRFSVCDFEVEAPGASYTILTVRHYRSVHPPSRELLWLIGLDALRDLGSWREAAALVDLCTIVTAARPGYAAPDWNTLRPVFREEQLARLAANIVETPRVEIDATALRRRAALGQSLRYFVPQAVEQYVRDHGLYQTKTGG